MKKIKNKIVVCSIIFSVVFLIIIPMIINSLYKIQSKNFFALWSAGDALQFYGSVLSTAGTCLVSAIALFQTRRLKEENDKLTFVNTKRPYFKIEHVYAKRKDQNNLMYQYVDDAYVMEVNENSQSFDLEIKILNCGDGEAVDFTYNGSYFGDDRGQISSSISKDKPYIIKKSINSNKNSQKIPIHYKNIIGCKYSQTIKIEIKSILTSEEEVANKKEIKVYPLSIQKSESI